MENLGFSQTETAQLLGVSRQTIVNRRRHFSMQTNWANITEDEIDILVQNIYSITPNVGERYMIGALRNQGIRVQRRLIRESISRVDPIGKAYRRARAIVRRQYSVHSPNSLWYVNLKVFHLDSEG